MAIRDWVKDIDWHKGWDFFTGGVTILDFANNIRKPAKAVLNFVSPEMAARIEHQDQKDEKGPVDNRGYIRTKFLLDGDLENPIRPRQETLEGFVAFLWYMNPYWAIKFIDFTGRQMPDDERFNYYFDLVTRIRDPLTGDFNSIHANQLRLEKVLEDGVIEEPRGLLNYLKKNRTAIVNKLQAIDAAIGKEAGKHLVEVKKNTDQAERDREDAKLARQSRSFVRKLWDGFVN